MRQLRILAPCIALFAWAGMVCGAPAAVKVRYFKGQPTFVSAMPASAAEVVVPPDQQKAKRIWIAIVALNFGNQPTSLGYENLDIRTTGGEAAKLIPYEDLRRHARVKAAWTTFFAGIAAGMNSYAAGRYGGQGRIGRLTYYDPVAGQMALDRANAENAELFGSISANLDATLAKLDGSVLRTTTIDPGTSFGGYVVFDLPKDAHLRDMVVTVSFAGNTHTISLNDTVGSLPQATASDLSGPPSSAVAVQPPVTSGVGVAVRSPSTPMSPVLTQPSQPDSVAPARKKCGMFQTDDGYRLVPCHPPHPL